MGLKQHAIFQGAQVLVNLAAAEDGQLHEGTMNVHLEGTMGGHHREGMMDGRHREGTMDVHPREETTDDHPREGMKLLALVAETDLRPIPEGDRTTIVLEATNLVRTTIALVVPKAIVVVVLRTITEKTIMIGETEIVVATIVQSVMTTEMTATIVQSATNNAMVVAMIGDTPILGGMQENPSAGTTQGLVAETLVQTMDQIEEDERRGQSPTQKSREEMSGGEMSHEGKIVTTRTIEADETASVIEEVATRTVYVQAMSLRSQCCKHAAH